MSSTNLKSVGSFQKDADAEVFHTVLLLWQKIPWTSEAVPQTKQLTSAGRGRLARTLQS